jgi:hypothetical protein
MMKTMFLHIVCATLLAATTIPVLAPAALLSQQCLVKWEMKERIETGVSEWITIPAPEMRWHVLGKECIINGRMFDVRQVLEENGLIRVLGIYDDKETEIEKELSKTGLPLDTERSMIIFQLLHLLSDDAIAIHAFIQPAALLPQATSRFLIHISSIPQLIPSPPPEA